MGVGSAGMAAPDVAMSGAADHGATVESDTARMAKTLSKQIEGMMTAQQWIAPKCCDADDAGQATPVGRCEGRVNCMRVLDMTGLPVSDLTAGP